jgi:hypothetical protein
MTTALFVVLVLCLGIVGPASAESWVLWEQLETGIAVGSNITSGESWKIIKSFEAKAECDEQAQKQHLVAALFVGKKAAEPPTPGVEYALRDDQEGFTRTITGKNAAGKTVLIESHRYLCLPSSFDPRQPKEKK